MASKIYILAENLTRAALSGFLTNTNGFEDMSRGMRKIAVDAVYKMLLEDINSVADKQNKNTAIILRDKQTSHFDLMTGECLYCGGLNNIHGEKGECPS